MSAEELAATFDHGSEQMMRDPYPLYDALRTQCPLGRSEKYDGFYVVSRYEDVKRVFSDYANFTSTHGNSIPPQPIQMYPIDLDPPTQTKFRRVLNPAFTAEAVNQYAPRIQQTVDRYVDAFAAEGTADLAAQLVRPIMPEIVLPIIGLPAEAATETVEQIDILTRRHKHDEQTVYQAYQGITKYILDLVARRRQSAPVDDIIGLLLKANIDGAELSDETIYRTVMIVLFGGLDTTTSVLLEAIYFLAANPEQKEVLRNSDDWSVAIEEFVRFTSPVQGLKRTVNAEVALSGGKLQVGEVILALLGSANRDPDVFDHPDRCLLGRAENPHLGFGIGAHICLGRYLARLEVRIVLRTLLERIPDFAVVPGFTPDYVAGETRGMKALPVCFSPIAADRQPARGARGPFTDNNDPRPAMGAKNGG